MDTSEKIPDILYKYRNWDDKYHKRILTNNEIYLASSSQFNDPFDASLPYKINEEDLTLENISIHFKSSYPQKPDYEIHELALRAYQQELFKNELLHEQQSEFLRQKFSTEFGIFSLAKNEMVFLMWSHYSNFHGGFCVGFNSMSLYKTIGGMISKVKYQKEFPTHGIFDDDIEFTQKHLFTKSLIWEYEDEFRIIKYEPSQRIINFSKECVEEIILGSKMPENDRSEILKIAESNFPDAKVFEIKLHKDKFELVKQQIL